MIFETRSRDTEMEGTMIKRIGLLTSGGDCQALNATMRGVVKGLTNSIDDLEVYGFDDGYKGLIYGKYRMLTSKDFSGILTQGGTILGTSRQPFKLIGFFICAFPFFLILFRNLDHSADPYRERISGCP